LHTSYSIEAEEDALEIWVGMRRLGAEVYRVSASIPAQGEKGWGTGLIGNRRIDPQGDIPVGAVLRAAIHAKFRIEGLAFTTGRYANIGTPEALSAAAKIVRFR
jgi:hypothetical protein